MIPILLVRDDTFDAIGGTMRISTAPEPEKTYKSPQRKLLNFFIKSRNGWKLKCREAKRTLKRVKNRLRYVNQSKERWKQRTRELEEECARLQQENHALHIEVDRLEKKRRSMTRA